MEVVSVWFSYYVNVIVIKFIGMGVKWCKFYGNLVYCI